jgi:PrtD family type I secretion system ABC transporter
MEKSVGLLNKISVVFYHVLWIVGFFGLFTNLLMLTVPIYMMQVYDRVLASHSHATLFYLTLIAIVATLVLVLVDHSRSKLLIYLSIWIDRVLNREALKTLADAVIEGRQYAFQIQRDITQVRQSIASPTTFSLMDWPFVPIYLLAIFMIHPMLGWLALLGAILLFGCAFLNEKMTHSLLTDANRKAYKSEIYLLNALRQSETILAMGMMANIKKQWGKNYYPVLHIQVKASEIAGVILGTTKFIRIVLQILLLAIGAYYVLQNQLTAGGMIAASIISGRALAPVEQSITIWKQLANSWESYKRLKSHLLTIYPRTLGVKLPIPEGAFRVENVTYILPNSNQKILQNISFEIQAGEMIALIGPSGSGKSTLAKLMLGVLKPTEGVLRLDSADVYQWDRDDFGKYVGYIPQDIQLFDGTIKDNIARFNVVNDKALIRATQLAGIHETILHLKFGYQTLISAQGTQLSAGQKQRIALARAIYNYPKIIVYDEPNSHLDLLGDLSLKQLMMQLKQDKVTQVIITHRPSIVEDADKVIVLTEGRLQMMGPKKQVFEYFKAPQVTTT